MPWRYAFHDRTASVLNGWGRERHRGELRVLMLHGLTDREQTGLENCQHKHLHVARFERLAAHLATHYDVLSMDELTDILEQGRPLPAFPAVLTFDDGFASNYHLAYPVLMRFGLPAIIYLETEFVDGKKAIWVDRVDYAMQQAGRTRQQLVSFKEHLKRLPHAEILAAVEQLEDETGSRLGRADRDDVPAIYKALDWTQVREMAASGLISFGSHTHSHVILGRAAPDVIRHELLESRRIIERETGVPCTHFCYPNGSPGDFSATSEELLREHGFRSSLTTVGGLNPTPCSPFLLRRLGMTNDLRPTQFEQYLAVGSASMTGIFGALGDQKTLLDRYSRLS
jgi:peptidoglycan/xylan/chitin deacetylase (PgdA/CDA1 family)